VLLFFTGPLVGYSFIQAVSLYGEASRPALVTPQMAAGLNPFDGVIVPTYGSIYLALTLLFPFVAIRMISGDKDSGALHLLLQTPVRPGALLASKVLILFFALFLAELPGFLALLQWRLSGGHIYQPETLCLLFGHFLYGLLVIAISLFAATFSESASTAALFALACTLGSWVLDFAAAGNSWLVRISGLSLTAALKPFEQGLFSWNVIFGIVIAVAGLLTLTLIWWHPGRPLAVKSIRSAVVVLTCMVLFPVSRFLTPSIDSTEDQRHSFSPAVSAALRKIHEPVRITLYLAPEDPRLMDFDHSILAKLRRVLPRAEIVNREASRAALFKTGEDPNYGLIVYEIGTRRAESRSTSPEEVLPLLWGLAAISPPGLDNEVAYPGFPLVVKSSSRAEFLFYVLWPALCFAGWFLFSRR
jgi:ABC-2 family transporter